MHSMFNILRKFQWIAMKGFVRFADKKKMCSTNQVTSRFGKRIHQKIIIVKKNAN